MLCDDAGFAIYLLLAIFQFVWLIMGAVWSNDVDDDCPARVLLMADVVMILTWIYIVLAVAIFLFSWCCSCCSEGLSHANQTFGPTFFGFFLGQESEQRRRSRQQQRHYRSAQREPPTATATAVPVSQVRGGAYGGGVSTSGGAVPIRNETDAQMAARLQNEEHGRFPKHVVAQPVAVTNVQLQPEPMRQQPPAQQQQSGTTTRDAAQTVGRGLMFGARLGAAALSAAATAVVDERERQRQQQQQQEQRRRP